MAHRYPTHVLVLVTFLLGGALVVLGEQVLAQTPTAPNLVLLWTTEDVVLPKAYLGRPLPTPGSTLRVSALLFPISAQTPELEYRWFLDGALLNRGQNLTSVTFVPASKGTLDVSVEIRRENALVSTAATSIPIGKPQLVILADGIGRVQSGISIPWKEEVIFRVIPAFFPRRQGESVLLQWSVDGVPVAGEEGSRDALTLTLAPGDLRPIRLEIDATNANRQHISANSGVVVNLGP